MKYVNGMAIAVATIAAVIFQGIYSDYSLPHCLAIGACIGMALDFCITTLLKRIKKT